MKTFKSFVTKRSLTEGISTDKIELFNKLLTIALSQGELKFSSSPYNYLFGELEDTGFSVSIEMFDIFINYFNKFFKGIKPRIKHAITNSLANLSYSEEVVVGTESKHLLKLINAKWTKIIQDAKQLQNTDPTVGYISVDLNFTTAVITLLESTSVDSPEVRFFLPAF